MGQASSWPPWSSQSSGRVDIHQGPEEHIWVRNYEALPRRKEQDAMIGCNRRTDLGKVSEGQRNNVWSE